MNRQALIFLALLIGVGLFFAVLLLVGGGS